MDQPERGKDRLLKELLACQQRLNEAEKRRGHKGDLQEATAAFERLFELAPDALIVVERRGRIKRMNRQAERLFGYTRRELVGQDHDVLVPQRAQEKHDREMKLYMEQPRMRVMGIGLELWGRRKDGTEFPADIDLAPLAAGPELSVISVVRDVTPRKRLEEELAGYRQRLEEMVVQRTADFAGANERLAEALAEHEKTEAGLALRSTILDRARVAIFLINPKGDFVYANEAASLVYGYNRDEFLVMNLRQLLRPEDGPALEERLKEILEKGQVDVETIHLRKDGAVLSVQARHSLIKTQHGEFIVTVINERKDDAVRPEE